MTRNEERFIERTISTAGKAINKYDLIREGDRVAVALSGGMDSLVLLETLALRKKRLPIDYHLTAVHVEMIEGFYLSDRPYLEDFCARLGVPLIWRRTSLGLEEDYQGTPCQACARKRRKELFDTAGELHCSKLALGHHMDDAIETLLLNMVFSGAMSSMPPALKIFGGEIDIIRPLILIREEDVKRYAGIRGFTGQAKECPHGGDTRRGEMKKILAQFQGMNRQAKTSIFRAMSNIHKIYLPPDKSHGTDA